MNTRWAALKFWLTVSACTIVCTALLTYLIMHQGAQRDDEGPAPPEEAGVLTFEKATPDLLMLDDKSPPRVDVKLRNAMVLGRPITAELKFHNDSGAPLQIALASMDPGCQEVAVDGKKLEPVGNAEPSAAQRIEKPSGAAGTLAITWIPSESNITKEKADACAIVVQLIVNDKRYHGPLRLRIGGLIVRSK